MQVTGVLADALNWAGISEDAFNEKLAACTDESGRNRLIMETLAGTYDDASDAFYRNNEALVESRKNQAALDESLAKVGSAVATVKNAFIKQFTPAISSAAETAANFIENIDPEEITQKVGDLIDMFQNLLPIITGVTAATVAYKAAVSIASIIDAVRKSTESMSIAQAALNAVMSANPFVLIATLIAAVGTALVTLYMTNEDFRNKVNAAWASVKSTISNAVSAIRTFFTETIPNAITNALQFFVSLPESFRNIGTQIVQGLWQGITQKFQWLKNNVAGFVNNIKSWFTGAGGFDTHSPSKWSAGVMENVMGGLSIGAKDGLPGALAAIEGATNRIKNSMNFGTANVDFSSSGIGKASAASNSFVSSLSSTFDNMTIVVQSVLDGKVIGETAYKYSRNKERAMGV